MYRLVIAVDVHDMLSGLERADFILHAPKPHGHRRFFRGHEEDPDVGPGCPHGCSVDNLLELPTMLGLQVLWVQK